MNPCSDTTCQEELWQRVRSSQPLQLRTLLKVPMGMFKPWFLVVGGTNRHGVNIGQSEGNDE